MARGKVKAHTLEGARQQQALLALEAAAFLLAPLARALQLRQRPAAREGALLATFKGPHQAADAGQEDWTPNFELARRTHG